MKKIKFIAAAMAAVSMMSFASFGSYADKIKTIGGLKYRYSDSGESKGLLTGWVYAKDGSRYYYKDGVMKKSCWLKMKSGSRYYIRKTGKMAVGKVKIGGVVYDFGSDGKLIDDDEDWFISTEITELTTGYAKIKFKLDYVEKNFNESSIWFGPKFKIEQKTDGKWTQIDKKIYDEMDYNDYINEFYKDNGYAVTETARFCRDMPAGEYRIGYGINKMDNNNKIKSKTIYTEFKITETTPNKYGVWLETKNLKKTSMTLVINQNKNIKPSGEITYGEEYRIEKLNDKGEWEALEVEMGWDDIGYLLDIGGKNELKLDWNSSYGTLLMGKYRLVLPMLDFRKTADFDRFESYAYFDITETTPNKYGMWLEVNEYNSEKLSVTIRQKDINFEGTISNSDYWELQYKDKNGKWKKAQYTADEVIYPDGDYEIKKYGSITMKMNFGELYGKLTKGVYRMKIPFNCSRYVKNEYKLYDSINIYAYFEIL